MKNCFAIPTLIYLLRKTKAFMCGHKLAELTQLMRATFERITNVKITDEAWDQADIASLAYISSSISCHDLISALLEHEPDIVLFQQAVTDWRAKVNPDKAPPRKCHCQKSWTEPIGKRCQEELIAHAHDIHLARLRGYAAPGSGDWLYALPSSALGLSLSFG